MYRQQIRSHFRPLLRLECRHQPRRNLIAAPKSNSGPLMTRRSDRALPPLPSSTRRWIRTLPIFLIIIGASCLGIFNYQKASSSIVNSILYALRTSPKARDILGDEIYFRDKVPWIWGQMNQVQGIVNISFAVKGNRGKGWMKFKSIRNGRLGYVSVVFGPGR